MSRLEPTLHRKLESIFFSLAIEINKAKKNDPQALISEFEKSTARIFMNDYADCANKAIKRVLSFHRSSARSTNKTTASHINAIIADEMSKFGTDKNFISDVEDIIAKFYAESLTGFINTYRIVKKAKKESTPKAELSVNFTARDLKAVQVLANFTVQTAGKYFPDQIQGKTAEVVKEVIFDNGLSIKEASIQLENELRGALGVGIDEVIPTHYATNPQAYFEIVTSNAAVQATSLSRVISMDEVGIDKFEVVAVIDNRTSEICRAMDGKILSVAKASAAVDKFLAAESLNDIQNLMPFSNDGSIPSWVSSGRGFPPYHHKCRTMVIPA